MFLWDIIHKTLMQECNHCCLDDEEDLQYAADKLTDAVREWHLNEREEDFEL